MTPTAKRLLSVQIASDLVDFLVQHDKVTEDQACFLMDGMVDHLETQDIHELATYLNTSLGGIYED